MNTKRRRIITTALVLVIIIGSAFAIHIYLNRNVDEGAHTIRIKNISDIPVLPDTEKTTLENALYFTAGLNTLDGIPRNITTIIRDGSFSQTENDGIYATIFIVDIPEIKQSFRIENSFSNRSMSDTNLVDYTTQVWCLDKSELIFGDFDCKDIFNSM